jgi:hypothetical protein
VNRLLRLIQMILTEIDLRFSEKRVIHGIAVYHTSDRTPSDKSYAGVAESLAVIGTFDPRRLEGIRRYLRRIVVAAQSRTVYWRFARACALSDQSLSTQPAIWIASVLVHEGTHARLHGRGIEPNDMKMRARIERTCVREQIRFLMRVPGSEVYVRHLERELDEGSWFSDEERKAATVDRLRALDAPAWLIKWMKRQ